MCIPKIGSLLTADREILNMEFFFHKQYGIFIPKRLPTSNSYCFKTSKAIELDPKRMEYFIFSTPEYFFANCIIARTRTNKKIIKRLKIK